MGASLAINENKSPDCVKGHIQRWYAKANAINDILPVERATAREYPIDEREHALFLDMLANPRPTMTRAERQEMYRAELERERIAAGKEEQDRLLAIDTGLYIAQYFNSRQ